jgi:hypothetical protein
MDWSRSRSFPKKEKDRDWTGPEGTTPLVSIGTPTAICESAEGRKSIGGVGVRETGCDEVKVPTTADETGLDPFAGGAQLNDVSGVSPVTGHVSGNSPVRKLFAPIDEEGEDVVRPIE